MPEGPDNKATGGSGSRDAETFVLADGSKYTEERSTFYGNDQKEAIMEF